MIAIINYQRGNLNNVLRAFQNFGYDTRIIDTPDNLKQYSGIVLPGVGAFGDAIDTMRKTGFEKAVKDYIDSDKPFMGICLGLQLLFEEGVEFGKHKGLGVFKGQVLPFRISEKVPHIGWNQIKLKKESRILKNMKDDDYYYFVHSYYVNPKDMNIVLTTTFYGHEFVSSIEKGNIFASQFHPEKSQTKGLDIIKSFGEYCVSHSGN